MRACQDLKWYIWPDNTENKFENRHSITDLQKEEISNIWTVTWRNLCHIISSHSLWHCNVIFLRKAFPLEGLPSFSSQSYLDSFLNHLKLGTSLSQLEDKQHYLVFQKCKISQQEKASPLGSCGTAIQRMQMLIPTVPIRKPAQVKTNTWPALALVKHTCSVTLSPCS